MPVQQGGGQDSPVGVRPHFFQPRDLPSEDLLWIGDIEEIELAVHRQRRLLPGVKGLGTIPQHDSLGEKPKGTFTKCKAAGFEHRGRARDSPPTLTSWLAYFFPQAFNCSPLRAGPCLVPI